MWPDVRLRSRQISFKIWPNSSLSRFKNHPIWSHWSHPIISSHLRYPSTWLRTAVCWMTPAQDPRSICLTRGPTCWGRRGLERVPARGRRLSCRWRSILEGSWSCSTSNRRYLIRTKNLFLKLCLVLKWTSSQPLEASLRSKETILRIDKSWPTFRQASFGQGYFANLLWPAVYFIRIAV